MVGSGVRHLPLRCALLLWLLQGCVSAEDIIARVGDDATLLCSYNAKYYGKLSVCWGRGAIPNSGCGSEVIRSDGTSAVSRSSERYLLMGNLAEGDVSLTIRQVEESDSGTYGCRVDVPGWFNDLKHHRTLTVVAVQPHALKVEMREVKERTVTVSWSPVFDGGRPVTSYVVDLKNKQTSWDTAVRTEVSDPDLTQLTLVDLRPAKSYNLRMFAVNSVGMSHASNVLTITTKEAAPEGPPLDMQLEALSPHSIRVTWKPPSSELANGVLRSYSLSYREYDPAGRHFKRWHHLTVAATRGQESIILSNLKPSTKYGVLVQAKTNAGVGPASTAPLCTTLHEVHTTVGPTSTDTTMQTRRQETLSTSASTTAVESYTDATVWDESTTEITAVPPDPPVVQLKEVIDSSISLTWTPGFEGDSPITGYYLEYKGVNASWDYTKAVVDFSANQTEATIIEINPSTYNIRMFAKSSVGTSKASNVLIITTGRAGHQRNDSAPAVTPDSESPDAAAVVNESHNGHLAAIVMPVALVLLIVAVVTVWQIRRIKKKQGNLSMWVSHGALRYRGSESLQEL